MKYLDLKNQEIMVIAVKKYTTFMILIFLITLSILIPICYIHLSKRDDILAKETNNLDFFENNSIECSNKNVKMKEEDEKMIKYLSNKLKNAYQIIGRLNCKISSNEVSQNGGWCSSISGKNSTQHGTDKDLALALSEFLKNKRVASFGDGPGVYKEIINGLGEVISYDSFDGAPFTEITTDYRVKFLDLSIPIYHLDRYDWVISIEVAEHVPKKFEHIYLDNLVRHAKEGIILSWSKIGQGGHSHVNEQNFDYVKSMMAIKGFKHDELNSLILKQRAKFPHLKDNINVFKRADCFFD